MHSIIVGTAGHIDHGKTALVRALTGKDTDRLPEEKRRGITIDLGFADLDLGGVRIGFVDVPGHERFVRNMLAGAHGIDVVALVIAADEGVMPQTREHFDICRLLGVPKGLVVITKSDLVEEELLTLVRAEAEELVARSFLAGAPILAVSARTGSGLEELKRVLYEVALEVPARSSEMVTRLPVDRAFTLKGFGAVVTGTLVSGEIAEGDELELLPSGTKVRARGVQVHGNAVTRATAGQRTAVNLSGVEAGRIERGMVLAPPGRLRPSHIIDVHLNVLPSSPRAFRSRARVRLHSGAAEILGRVRVLESPGEIAPGESGFAQLRLEAPAITLPGEHFIIRSYSPSQTVAGGTVLDSFAVKHRGKDLSRTRERLTALKASNRASQFVLFAEVSGGSGQSLADIACRTGWNDDALLDAAKQATEGGAIVEADGIFITRGNFESLCRAAVDAVNAHHNTDPLARGLPRETLRERHFSHAAPEVFRAVLVHLEKEGLLVSEKEIVRAREHNREMSSADTLLRDRFERIYRLAGLEAPSLEEAGERAGIPNSQRTHGRKVLQLLIDAGILVRVADLFFHHNSLRDLQKKLQEYAAQHEPEREIDVAAFKDLAGVSRKYAIPLLEYLDRERITRRVGDRRIILKG